MLEKNNNFCICIPTLNRHDLLMPALMYYAIDLTNVHFFILDNGQSDLFDRQLFLNISGKMNMESLCPPKSLGVSESWNLLLVHAFDRGFEGAFVINDDVYWGADLPRAQMLANAYINEAKNKAFFTSTKNWCNFFMPKKVFQEVGQFDNQFYPAYFEDMDYKYRLKLAGYQVLQTGALDPVLYRNSMTIVKDPSINRFNENKAKYIKKWGGEPGSETFKTPYNK